MSGIVEFAIQCSVEALKDWNADLAQKVVNEDTIVNRYEIDIENQCLTILARQQPVAADLRLLLACVKINSDLERMGDHAVNIAQHALRLLKHPPVKPLVDLPHMAHIVQMMLKDALDAFIALRTISQIHDCLATFFSCLLYDDFVIIGCVIGLVATFEFF